MLPPLGLSPRVARRKFFQELYDNASIVPPRRLDVLLPLFEDGNLLSVADVFPSIKEAETRVKEYCEVQSCDSIIGISMLVDDNVSGF